MDVSSCKAGAEGLVRGELGKPTSILVPYGVSIWCGPAILGER